MSKLPDFQLRAVVRLQTDESMDNSFMPNGATFHRWLPCGRDDALHLKTGHADTELLVWCERLGRVVPSSLPPYEINGQVGEFPPEVRFDPERSELTDEIIATHGCLEGGPLQVLLRTSSWTEAEFNAVSKDDDGTDAYRKLARRLADNLLVPPLRRFVRTLQLDFGQYWLRDLEPWDSRKGSLGWYFQELGARWSTDGRGWKPFRPDPSVVQLYGNADSLAASRMHLSKEDWFRAPERADAFPLDSTALGLVTHARDVEDFRGDLRLAIVETATAAEVAVEEFLAVHRYESDWVKQVLPGFASLSAQARFAFVAGSLADVSAKLLLDSGAAWGFRHDVVHKGWRPKPTELTAVRKAIAALQEVTARLLGRDFRCVSAFERGGVARPEIWAALDAVEK